MPGVAPLMRRRSSELTIASVEASVFACDRIGDDRGASNGLSQAKQRCVLGRDDPATRTIASR
jgi:hypothetical protein